MLSRHLVIIILNILQLFGTISSTKMLLPIILPSFDKILEQSAQPWEIAFHVGPINKFQEIEIIILCKGFKLLEFLRRRRASEGENGFDSILDVLIVSLRL